mmetsp:Transcript_23202/g.26297  ORF Transcript_23202/g.26297 Transcript_23202/m.26297 type:complete len:201 (+) Transcript_23202:1578-2180(+)
MFNNSFPEEVEVVAVAPEPPPPIFPNGLLGLELVVAAVEFEAPEEKISPPDEKPPKGSLLAVVAPPAFPPKGSLFVVFGWFPPAFSPPKVAQLSPPAVLEPSNVAQPASPPLFAASFPWGELSKKLEVAAPVAELVFVPGNVVAPFAPGLPNRLTFPPFETFFSLLRLSSLRDRFRSSGSESESLSEELLECLLCFLCFL